jgi:hypothetical protein
MLHTVKVRIPYTQHSFRLLIYLQVSVSRQMYGTHRFRVLVAQLVRIRCVFANDVQGGMVARLFLFVHLTPQSLVPSPERLSKWNRGAYPDA